MIMAAVYALGTAGTWLYSRSMATISQSVMKDIRNDLFAKMQKLPISFFDTHTYGDVMSVYTNDTDTLRQMISQSLPMMISSAFSIVLTLMILIHFNLWLTLIVLAVTAMMICSSVKLVRRSRTYFAKQQASLGAVNGYIEEALGGQKVIKVFCHEREAKAQFERLTEELFANAVTAGGTAVTTMPVMSAFGNLQYLLAAIVGGAMALFGRGTFAITLGTLVSFLGLIRQFSSSISIKYEQNPAKAIGAGFFCMLAKI